MSGQRYIEQKDADYAQRLYYHIGLQDAVLGNKSRYQRERWYLVQQARWSRKNAGHRSEYYQHCMVGLRRAKYSRVEA